MLSSESNRDQAPVVVAAVNGLTSKVKSLLQQDSSTLDIHGASALHQACLHSHSEVVKLLLYDTELIKQLPPHVQTNIIMDTVKRGDRKVLEILLQSGFQASMKEKGNSCTVLFHACVYGHQEVVEQLASLSNVNEPAMQNVTPLMTAALYMHSKVIPQLLQYGADINVQSSDGTTALMCAILSKDVKTVNTLLENQADASLATDTGTTALMLATKVNSVGITKALLRYSTASINHLDNSGRSALMMACDRVDTHEELMNLLIKYGADINKKVDGRHVLLWATLHGFLSTIKAILYKDTDINTTGPSNETALMIAAERGFLKIVKYLISQKADVNRLSSYLGTALHYAAANNREDTVRYLIRQKPIIFKNQNRKTPSLVAKHNKHSAVQNILEDYEKKVNIKPYPGDTTQGSSVDDCENDSDAFLPKLLNHLKQFMQSAPLISHLYNKDLLSEKMYEEIRWWGPMRQAEYVTNIVIGPRLKKHWRETEVVIRQALLDSRNHVNRSLAQLLTLRNRPDCMDHEAWKVFLTKEERDCIKRHFMQNFIKQAKVKDVILQLRTQCALDEWQEDKLKTHTSMLDKADILVSDILLRGTVETLNHFKRALETTAHGSAHGHWILLRHLQLTTRPVTAFEQFFDRQSTVRVSQRAVHFENTNNRKNEERPYQRKLREDELTPLRVSVRDRIKMYEKIGRKMQ